jgi:2,3-diketo-5-methylthio-1-phosphopentane phosphatase
VPTNADISPAQRENILVSDFDGTMTRRDFYDLARGRWPLCKNDDPWERYVAGQCTHFEALAEIFGRIRADLSEVESLLDDMHLDPALPHAIASLKKAGWRVIIASAGCEWYIRKLLARANLNIEVHANPGVFSPAAGLQMSLPRTSPFFSASTGIDKAAIVEKAKQDAPRCAFCGDGRPDLAPALAVPESRRFATGWLAETLTAQGASFIRFNSWSEIAQHLI